MTPWRHFVVFFCRTFGIGQGQSPEPESPEFERPPVYRTDPAEAARAERAVKALEAIARALSPRYWDDDK